FLRPSGARLVSVIHDALPHPGEPLAPFARLRTRIEVGAADCVVTLSDHVARELRRGYGDAVRRSVSIPHLAIGAAPGAAAPRRHPAGRSFGLMLFGRLLEYKGISRLLRAYELVRHAGLPVTLSLIGQGNVAPYREALERLPDVVLVNRWLSDQEIPGILG